MEKKPLNWVSYSGVDPFQSVLCICMSQRLSSRKPAKLDNLCSCTCAELSSVCAVVLHDSYLHATSTAVHLLSSNIFSKQFAACGWAVLHVCTTFKPELDMGPFCKIQSSNLMTQSNPIHDNSVYSDPHPIQSTLQTIGKIVKNLNHGCTFVKH